MNTCVSIYVWSVCNVPFLVMYSALFVWSYNDDPFIVIEVENTSLFWLHQVLLDSTYLPVLMPLPVV